MKPGLDLHGAVNQLKDTKVQLRGRCRGCPFQVTGHLTGTLGGEQFNVRGTDAHATFNLSKVWSVTYWRNTEPVIEIAEEGL